MSSVVDSSYWDSSYAKAPLVYRPELLEFRDLFAEHLRPGGSCFEVGCYPGSYLLYLCKTFGYVANGIDQTPFVRSRLPAYFEEHGVEVDQLWHDDFMILQTDRKFDVVCSFGFLEHFRNFGEIIERHMSLVATGGILIISCPNFRGLQWAMHRLVDPVNLERHVLPAMDLEAWKRILARAGMTPLYHGYYRTADFWFDTPRPGRQAARFGRWLGRVARRIDQRLHWPNGLTSPHMISISRR